MTAFIGSFLQYLIIMLILVALAVLGVVLGIKWRKAKDEKLAAEATVAKEEAVSEEKPQN